MLISVVIPAFDEEDYLGRTLASLNVASAFLRERRHGRKKYLHFLLLILLLTFSQSTFAQPTQEQKSRDVLVKESIANLDSNNIHVAAQAARYLGIFRATEGVPAMLRVLQSSRHLWLLEHQMAGINGTSEYVLIDVKGDIIAALGEIGDRRAVPVLKKYLRKPPRGSEVFPGSVAFALYQITGKSYKYKDRDGKMRLFRPSNNLH